MRFTRHKRERSDFEVVVTSMLDINFLLIMFFMMTAQFQRHTHATLDLPQEAGEKDPQRDEAGLVINITDRGAIIVAGVTIDLAELERRVDQELDRLPGDSATNPLKLMVRADRNARTSDLNRIVTMLREQGVGVIRIATETPL